MQSLKQSPFYVVKKHVIIPWKTMKLQQHVPAGGLFSMKKILAKKIKVAELPLHATGLDSVLESFFYFSSVTPFQGLSLSYL